VRANSRGFCVQDNQGTLICDINAATPEGIARQIAMMATEIQKTGFEQGRAHVRQALGCQP